MPRALAALGLCLLLGVAALVSAGGEAGARSASRAAPAPATFPAAMSRVVSARVYHTRFSTVRNSTSRRIGRSLASLRPTWISGMLRYARNQYPLHGEVRAWKRIRRIVRGTSPAAQFDVVLNALQYRTPAAIARTMRRLRAKLGNDGWFFDFFSNAYRSHPRMIRAAINSAHAHGEWIGGNIFHLAKHRPLPARADFYSVQDHVFYLNLPAVRKLARRKPILYHLNSDPGHQRSGGCRFIERLSTKRRRAHVRRRAAQQVRYGFRVSYPALFPQCMRARPRGPGHFLYAYNAFRDPPMAREIGRLLDRHDFSPGT